MRGEANWGTGLEYAQRRHRREFIGDLHMVISLSAAERKEADGVMKLSPRENVKPYDLRGISVPRWGSTTFEIRRVCLMFMPWFRPQSGLVRVRDVEDDMYLSG